MKYSKEFRQQAIKLFYETGVQEACKQLRIIYGTLADWRKARNRILAAEPGGEEPLTERERKLMNENAQLCEENGIFKDAFCFFVNDWKR